MLLLSYEYRQLASRPKRENMNRASDQRVQQKSTKSCSMLFQDAEFLAAANQSAMPLERQKLINSESHMFRGWPRRPEHGGSHAKARLTHRSAGRVAIQAAIRQ